MEVHSPLSTRPPVFVRALPQAKVRDSLTAYFGVEPPLEAVSCDYTIYRCAETGLEFAHPPTPGNGRFYEWLSGFSFYYPGFRWEFKYIAKEINRQGVHGLLIDIGCGDGHFLDYIKKNCPQIRAIGIDFNSDAVVKCRAKGLECYTETTDELIRLGVIAHSSASVVTSFHCLEHVPDPLDFLRMLAALCAPDGFMAVSTPLSPMSFEAGWFDIQNHPPHHMTRWTEAAYKKAGQLLGSKTQILLGDRVGYLRAVRQIFRLNQGAPFSLPRMSELAIRSLKNAKEFRRQFMLLLFALRKAHWWRHNSVLVVFKEI